MKKRYIEDVLPLAELNKYAQKGGGIGSLNVMHPYFARRPLTASRAMTLAALVDAPETEAEREALEHLLVELSSEEWPEMDDLLHRARELIRDAHDDREPRVLDPFAGGGSMPLEALRLGCEATALDLNPVAYLALIASLIYPQRYGRVSESANQRISESLDAGAEEELTQYEIRNTLPGMEAAGGETPDLVEDIEYWADWVMTHAQAQIGECYPVDDDGAVPVAYLWTKTIQCPHCGGEVPLIRRRWLHKRKGKTPVAYRLHVDREAQTYTVEIVEGPTAVEAEPERGTMRGATVECPYCGTPTERERIAEQGRAGQMGQHLLVVVLNREDETGREFRAATEADRAAFRLAEEKLAQAEEEGYDFWGFERLLSVVPDEPMPPEGVYGISPNLYGVETWGEMFNARQLLTLVTFGQQIRLVRDLLAEESEEYAKAITLYLSILISRYITRSSNTTTWDTGYTKLNSIFARHDIQMTWDYAEANPFSGSAGSWESHLNVFLYSIEHLIESNAKPAEVHVGSATHLPEKWTGTFDAVVTDPPYYHSVPYACLTDYFYPWHKRIVGDDYPEAFVTEVTPKEQELVQEAIYHGGTRAKAKQFYEDGMAEAFAEMHRVLREDGIAVVMFAHKKSSAWETLVSALIRAGFRITASWPLNTEGRRLQSYRAVALASSVYLVCRKRTNGGQIGYLEDIRSDLTTTIRRYLERFWAAGIGGADFFMSAIGPGLSVYSRYERVERYDGSRVSVSDFLDLVRHEVAAFAIERIVGRSEHTEAKVSLDQPTQFYLLWRWGYGQWDVPDGEAVLLSTAVGIDLGVLMDRIGLVGKVKRKLRLLSPAEREAAGHGPLEKVVERVAAGGAVPLIDVLHKSCLLWERDQQEELAALVAARGGEMWPVAQAMVELLPRDNAERKALMSLLSTRADLEQRASRWAETHRRERKIEGKQLEFWRKGKDDKVGKSRD